MNDSVPYICWQDFLRAGMTCFTLFYQEGAQSYQDLAHRINWLFTAQQHMQVRLGSCMHPQTSNMFMYSKALTINGQFRFTNELFQKCDLCKSVMINVNVLSVFIIDMKNISLFVSVATEYDPMMWTRFYIIHQTTILYNNI